MIYWLTGQPGAGKTVLAKKLYDETFMSYHIDGDDLRELTKNKNYVKLVGEFKIKTNHGPKINGKFEDKPCDICKKYSGYSHFHFCLPCK